MEVDHHKSHHPPCLHVEQSQEEEGLISLSQAEVEGKAEEADAFDVTFYLTFCFSLLFLCSANHPSTVWFLCLFHRRVYVLKEGKISLD